MANLVSFIHCVIFKLNSDIVTFYLEIVQYASLKDKDFLKKSSQCHYYTLTMKSNSFILSNMLSMVHVRPNHFITLSSFYSSQKLNIHNGKKPSNHRVQFLPSMIQSPWSSTSAVTLSLRSVHLVGDVNLRLMRWFFSSMFFYHLLSL